MPKTPSGRKSPLKATMHTPSPSAPHSLAFSLFSALKSQVLLSAQQPVSLPFLLFPSHSSPLSGLLSSYSSPSSGNDVRHLSKALCVAPHIPMPQLHTTNHTHHDRTSSRN